MTTSARDAMPCPRTVGEALAVGSQRLRAAGVEGGARDSRLILEAVLGCQPGETLGWPERRLDPELRARFVDAILARVGGKPVSRIIARREFWSLSLRIDEGTLDPRPESETLVAAILDRLADRSASPRILDLGTGTGCLLLALLTEVPNARGLGVDASERAVRVARGNAEELGLSDRADWIVGDWASPLAGIFDVVVCNPPYIRTGEAGDLPVEVRRHDPPAALFAGEDGLAAYRVLAPEIARILAPGGQAAFEVGDGQSDDVMGLMREAGLHTLAPVCDLAGRARCVIATPGSASRGADEKNIWRSLRS